MEVVKSDDLITYVGVHSRLRDGEELDDCYFSLFCTDLTHFWILQQTEEDFKTVYEALNPSLEAPSSRILKHIIDSIKSKSFTFKKLKKESRSILSLKIESNLARLPFRWHADLRIASPEMVHQLFSAPLLGLCYELQRRQSNLFSNYRHKDSELRKVAMNCGVRLFPNKNFPDHDTLEAFDATMTSNEEAMTNSANIGAEIFSQPNFVSLLSSIFSQPLSEPSSTSSPPNHSVVAEKSSVVEKPSKSIDEQEKERRQELKKKLECVEAKQKPKKKKKGLF